MGKWEFLRILTIQHLHQPWHGHVLHWHNLGEQLGGTIEGEQPMVLHLASRRGELQFLRMPLLGKKLNN
jgi:hypothetical protein